MTLLNCRAIRLPKAWLTQSGFVVHRVEGSVGPDDFRLNTTARPATNVISDARDEVWFSVVGEHGWVVLTKDHRLRYRNIERAALTTAKVAAFILTSGDLQGVSRLSTNEKLTLPTSWPSRSDLALGRDALGETVLK
jgi:hypothetical protein